MQACADLAHITGSCVRCARTNLSAAAFFEADLRKFLMEQTTARGRSAFTDVRTDVHEATKKMEVAGAKLFCRACVEAERAAAAASDTTWNDGDTSGLALDAKIGATMQAHAMEQETVADSWEDD